MEVADAYIQFRQSLLNYIRSKINSKEDAHDILQNIFAKISGNVKSLSQKENIQNWLFAVTRNAIIDYYRVNASKKNKGLDLEAADSMFEEEAIDETQGLDQCIHSVIELLPDDYKSIIIDAELKGVKQKELAIKYNMPYSSLRSRVQRGRERLKELFYNCCYIHTDNRGNVLERSPKGNCENSCNPCGE